ncbi:hypothetical protein C7447_102554 [Tenacibaculum adriaticum]|uniref:Uncharacterized protein n=1 Tax=Tenacibaculum adriaticum TaxID=413713 RepID=A0A5S5DWS9_9FLAO|nr:hypothetical protein [Tenacibaculum adriaticum]TYP99232.1 hypothetical protein C7447_102554 [Tenacibaculum adriaticum]
MKNIIYLIAFSFFGYSLNAQDSNTFFNQITLRKSFQSKNDKAEPAIITYSKPKNKNESWLLNAAIGINVLPNTTKALTLSPYIEYHKNTLIDKEQENFQTGLALEWQLRNISTKKWTPVFISSLKYNEDKIKNISSFQGNYYFTPLLKGKAKDPKYFYIPNTVVDFGKLFQFVYSPYIGIENENRFSTEDSSDKGYIYRAYFRITSNISLFPSCEKLKEKFEFNIDWQYRYNIQENVDNLNKFKHKYFTANFNYIFFTTQDGKKSAKIGLDYTNGENPSKNFEEQSFYAVNLKIKF